MSTRSFWWLSDFKLTPKGIIVRKNGRRLGEDVITLTEIGKWLSYYALVRLAAAARRMANPTSPRVWFGPDAPRPWYVIWAALSWAGFRFAKSERVADVRIHFEDATWTIPHDTYLNGRCSDISKSRVARVFGEIAGYPLALNPRTHHGPAVEKSELNGAHDGRIVHCPCAPAADKCYQKLIAAEQDGVAVDWRTSIVDGKLIAIVRKTKPLQRRFSIHNSTAKLVEVPEIFSPAEIVMIEEFCAAMKLDWGALDILRDADGRLYIVDVNKTDTGPAVDLSWRDRIALTSALAKALLSSTKNAKAQASMNRATLTLAPR